MKKFQLNTNITIFEERSELPDNFLKLLSAADEAAANAYAPYSNFKVGAAILLNNNQMVTANNQENAVYPTGLCAERNAVFSASAHFPNTPIKIIAITAINATNSLNKPVPPCGSCRQALLEYEEKFNQPIQVLMAGQTGQVYLVNSVAELLPCTFNSEFIK